MAIDVVMPQMGESIAEGTVVRWLKQVGQAVGRDEPLFEISTDKVDAEIPSPAEGVLLEIRVKDGETVPVNSIVAVIGEAGGAEPPAPAAAPPVPAGGPRAATPAPAPPSVPPPDAPPPDVGPADEARPRRSSPLARRIAQEHQVDLSKVSGTGIGGRVTKDDILGFIAAGPAGSATAAPRQAPAPTPAPTPAVGDRVEKLTVMRKKIAEHMVASRRTSAHVHSVFEVNFGRVAAIREAKKADYARAGAKLTYLSFIIKAAVDALAAQPILNASVDGDTIVYHGAIHVGIAVALDWGLIVPVIKHAEDKNLLGLSRAIEDLATRARAKQLKPDEVAGGTFTVTNPGGFGGQFGLPIINQPQVAILGVGAIEKRPVVVDNAIGIRPMAYLTLGFDHRIIDGAVADEFLSNIKRKLESWNDATDG